MSTKIMQKFKSNKQGACILCGNSVGTKVYEEAGFNGILCDCGIVFIDPLPPAEAIDPKLDLHLESYYSFPAKLRINWIEKFTAGRKLLDVGAGNGATVDEACRRGFDVSAIEPNAECANLLFQKYGIAVEQTIIQNSQQINANYNVIFHIDLLSHFPDPVQALKKMGSLLDNTDGVLCFEVGIFGGMNQRWYKFAGRPGFPQHLWFFFREKRS